MNEDLKFWLSIILMIAIMLAIMLAVPIGFSVTYNVNYCKTMQSLQPEFEFQWVLWGGCLVQTPSGYWINAKEYKYLEGDVR